MFIANQFVHIICPTFIILWWFLLKIFPLETNNFSPTPRARKWHSQNKPTEDDATVGNQATINITFLCLPRLTRTQRHRIDPTFLSTMKAVCSRMIYRTCVRIHNNTCTSEEDLSAGKHLTKNVSATKCYLGSCCSRTSNNAYERRLRAWFTVSIQFRYTWSANLMAYRSVPVAFPLNCNRKLSHTTAFTISQR